MNLKPYHRCVCLRNFQKYIISPMAVMAVSKKLTQGSWQTIVGLVVALMVAAIAVGALYRAIAATRVFSFFCFIITLIMGISSSILVMARLNVKTLKVLVSQNSVLGCLSP